MKYWQHIPPLKAMLAVEATARLGSFSKAASELNVTQSAVSHLVNQAEAFVNTQLFQRQLRPVQLTPEGRRFVEAIVAGLSIIRAEGEALQRTVNSDTLTVSCNLAYANFWLLPRLTEFQDLHPDVTVNVVTAYQGLPPLTNGIDLSVRFGNGDWPETVAHLLFAEMIVPVASVSYVESLEVVRSPQRHRFLDRLLQPATHSTFDGRTPDEVHAIAEITEQFAA
jgi:LysR family transcriptional regulator, glycine cleavage system transcriptional activator